MPGRTMRWPRSEPGDGDRHEVDEQGRNRAEHGQRDQRQRQAGVETHAARERDLVEVRDHRQDDQQHEQPGPIPAGFRRQPEQGGTSAATATPWIARPKRLTETASTRSRPSVYTAEAIAHADGWVRREVSATRQRAQLFQWLMTTPRLSRSPDAL